jgi:hypothetical protein
MHRKETYAEARQAEHSDTKRQEAAETNNKIRKLQGFLQSQIKNGLKVIRVHSPNSTWAALYFIIYKETLFFLQALTV